MNFAELGKKWDKLNYAWQVCILAAIYIIGSCAIVLPCELWKRQDIQAGHRETYRKKLYIYLLESGKARRSYVTDGKIWNAHLLSGSAVYFYTTDGTYIEWNGDYMVSDKPL